MKLALHTHPSCQVFRASFIYLRGWLSSTNGFRLCPGSCLGVASDLANECACTEDLSCCLHGTKCYERRKARSQFGRQVARPALLRFRGCLEALPDYLLLTFFPFCPALPHEPTF